jgi:predicted small metal-binding protein
MAKVLRCTDVRGSNCEAVFRGVLELEVLAQILEHWSAVHGPYLTTTTLVSRIRKAIRTE